jgi:FMN phosphatase YigB (HAD superfamily)
MIIDADVSALAAEIFYTNVQLHGVPADDRNAQDAALRQAHEQHAELLAFAAEWDEFVATCSASEARNAVLSNTTPPHVREQLRQEFN